MLVYRIVHILYSRELYASGLEGRWNREGKKVLYTAGSVALAFLENMVRRQGVGFNSDFKTMIIEIPDQLPTQVVKVKDLPVGWRRFTDYSACQALGDVWFERGEKPVFKVPSAVLPEEYNYVINFTHTGFKKIRLIETVALVPDERIEQILKTYSGK